jgi:glycosyltransferase involved in cell wall biosynthesis
MRILHIYKDYYPVLGGIENHVRLLATGQVARGHQVTVLVTNTAGLRTTVRSEDGVQVIRAGRLATVASTPLSVALPWLLLHQHPDLTHLHFPYPVGEFSHWLLRRSRRTVLTYHSDVVRQASILRFYRPVLARVLRFVNAIIVSSPPMRGSMYLAEHQAKVHLIPFGIPLDRFLAAPAAGDLERVRRQHLAASWPLDDPASLLLFVGRLRYYKGLDTLIRALPGIPAHLAVVGTGPMAAEWRALALATGVGHRIAWLGEVSDADLPAIYHCADLFVLPASHPSEAFGLVQIEAMAAGLPVVCTELGTGTSYVNQDGVTGRVVRPRDPHALAEAIKGLLADAGLRARMSTAARQRAQAEFDLNLMVDRVLALYGALL